MGLPYTVYSLLCCCLCFFVLTTLMASWHPLDTEDSPMQFENFDCWGQFKHFDSCWAAVGSCRSAQAEVAAIAEVPWKGWEVHCWQNPHGATSQNAPKLGRWTSRGYLFNLFHAKLFSRSLSGCKRKRDRKRCQQTTAQDSVGTSRNLWNDSETSGVSDLCPAHKHYHEYSMSSVWTCCIEMHWEASDLEPSDDFMCQGTWTSLLGNGWAFGPKMGEFWCAFMSSWIDPQIFQWWGDVRRKYSSRMYL